MGYEHLPVNHSETFKDPDTGACTNHIENEWLHLKKSLPKYGTLHKHIQGYLARHMWHMTMKEENKDVFIEFLNAARTVYNPNTWDIPSS